MPQYPPMLADFSVRLAFGLATLLLATRWQRVPLPFFRTQCQIILGLVVLASLDASRSTQSAALVWTTILAALLAYFAAVAWGLGLVRIAQPTTCLVVIATLVWVTIASFSSSGSRPVEVFNTASRLASGLLLGASLTAMLLGHHYLTAPTMSIEPLRQYVRIMGAALLLRGMLAIGGLWLAHILSTGGEAQATENGITLLCAARWAVGYAGPILATILAWKTVQIRSTQSATGILYVATALVLFGELTSLISTRAGGLSG